MYDRSSISLSTAAYYYGFRGEFVGIIVDCLLSLVWWKIERYGEWGSWRVSILVSGFLAYKLTILILWQAVVVVSVELFGALIGIVTISAL